MKRWPSDVIDFLVAVVRWWQWLVTGSLIIAVNFLYEHVKQPLGAATAVNLFGFGFFLLAIFLAWREERGRVRALEPLPLAPAIDIEHYDPVLRPDQSWGLRVRDRNNPELVFTVEIVRGLLYVGIQNQHGRDQSARRRPVRIEVS